MNRDSLVEPVVALLVGRPFLFELACVGEIGFGPAGAVLPEGCVS